MSERYFIILKSSFFLTCDSSVHLYIWYWAVFLIFVYWYNKINLLVLSPFLLIFAPINFEIECFTFFNHQNGEIYLMINILKKDWSRVMFWLWNLKAKSHANYIGLIKKHLYACSQWPLASVTSQSRLLFRECWSLVLSWPAKVAPGERSDGHNRGMHPCSPSGQQMCKFTCWPLVNSSYQDGLLWSVYEGKDLCQTPCWSSVRF